MNRNLLAIAILTTLTACSSTKNNAPVTNHDDQIRSQRLSTNFVADGIKVVTSCKWYNPWKDDCEVIAIESTAVTFTNGNSSANLRNALVIAGDKARAQVSHFIREDITSTRVTNTIAKNVEKAKDVITKNPNSQETVDMTDSEAEKTNASTSTRENSNNTARQLTTTVRANSNAILRGFKVIRQDVVGPQEVLVTIRWDQESEAVARALSRKFGSNPYNK